jgi:hypothetical protein
MRACWHQLHQRVGTIPTRGPIRLTAAFDVKPRISGHRFSDHPLRSRRNTSGVLRDHREDQISQLSI